MRDYRQKDRGKDGKKTPSSSSWVAWIAIGLGVFMIVVGVLLLLWGLSYQATVGETSEISEGSLVGGPALIPIGVLSIAFGSLWLHNGLKGFARRSDEHEMKKCPYCGKNIEADLNFCYYCTRTFDDGKEEDADKTSDIHNREEERDDPVDENGMTSAQRRRHMRQEARRRLQGKKKSEASSLDDLVDR